VSTDHATDRFRAWAGAILARNLHHARDRSAQEPAAVASGQDKTPFAAVLWFRPDKTITVAGPADRATLAGFRTPAYEQGISVAGYHLHFLNQDRRHGGHALDFALDHGEAAISTASELHLSLPRTGRFLSADLSPADTNAQIKQIEDS
jgi:alpha-acetolactate decarboxylase